MDKLILFNLILIAIIVLGLWVSKKLVRSERGKTVLFIFAAILTIACHYSSILFHQLSDGSGVEHLRENPNFLLPIYPCNVVMWSCVIFALCKNKGGKFASYLADYIFWFGIISSLVGMFANVDFIKNPTLLEYDITKSIAAHATLLFNILLLPLFGYIRIDLKRNLTHIIISVIMMFFIGLYCNLALFALVSEEFAYYVNSMFLLHSPFDGLDFLTYPIIAMIAIPLYFGLFAICEMFAYKKGERFYNRFIEERKAKKEREAQKLS